MSSCWKGGMGEKTAGVTGALGVRLCWPSITDEEWRWWWWWGWDGSSTVTDNRSTSVSSGNFRERQREKLTQGENFHVRRKEGSILTLKDGVLSTGPWWPYGIYFMAFSHCLNAETKTAPMSKDRTPSAESLCEEESKRDSARQGRRWCDIPAGEEGTHSKKTTTGKV